MKAVGQIGRKRGVRREPREGCCSRVMSAQNFVADGSIELPFGAACMAYTLEGRPPRRRGSGGGDQGVT